MVHHDEELGSERRSITAFTEAELRENPETSHVPSLEDVLIWADGRVAVYIELKGSDTPEPVAALIRRRGARDQVVVGSFERQLVAGIRSAAPELSTSILFHSTDLNAAIRVGLELGVAYLHPCWKRVGDSPADLLDRHAMDRVRSAGLGLVTWDEDRPNQLMTLLTKARPDAISTNHPATTAHLRATM
jgi:glycerophosphoryl diester phosphodiesterase